VKFISRNFGINTKAVIVEAIVHEIARKIILSFTDVYQCSKSGKSFLS
jgi:hypothetical protein